MIEQFERSTYLHRQNRPQCSQIYTDKWKIQPCLYSQRLCGKKGILRIRWCLKYL
jgi:hypothetical protein